MDCFLGAFLFGLLVLDLIEERLYLLLGEFFISISQIGERVSLSGSSTIFNDLVLLNWHSK